MSPKKDAAGPAPHEETAATWRRPWCVPQMRRLATSAAENSLSIGPDAERVVS
jgi:hypothetical protein